MLRESVGSKEEEWWISYGGDFVCCLFFPPNPISLLSQVSCKVTSECEELSLRLDFFFSSFFFPKSVGLGTFLNQGLHKTQRSELIK